MYYAAGAEEKQRLEHGMGEEVEHGCHVAESAFMRICGRAYTESHYHEADLRDGAECQHPLDIALHAGYCRGIKGRECTHVCSDVEYIGSVAYEEREHPCHQIYTGYDHRRGMDEG